MSIGDRSSFHAEAFAIALAHRPYNGHDIVAEQYSTSSLRCWLTRLCSRADSVVLI
jgi:hypothetical protein